MNPGRHNHTRLRKRDSEVTTISTPTYAGEYIDKVSNLYSSPGARNNFGRQSIDEIGSLEQMQSSINREYDINEGMDEISGYPQDGHRPSFPDDIDSRHNSLYETGNVNDTSRKVDFGQVSLDSLID